MAMKILALVPEAVTARRCLETAYSAAEIANADVEVFHVKVDPEHLRTGDDEVALQHLRIRREGTAAARAAAVRTVYDVWRAHLPEHVADRVTWREAVGAEEAAVAAEAKGFDLLVLPRPHNLDGGDANHAAFRRSHRPLLVAPDRGAGEAGGFGRHIAIAWKPGAHTQRAVEGAAVWLRAAQQVSALMIAPDADRGGWAEFERLARQLGVTAKAVLIAPDRRRAAEVLVSAIHHLGADCAVVGAYRYADVVEWILPSTTRFVLDHARIPLFMAH
jgi:nucleotide-binding universal stress UspA family protein